MPIEKLVAQIEPQQDLHGYDAPWAGGAGKNLFDQDTCTTGKYIDAYGEPKDSAGAEYSDYIPVTAGEQYIFSGTNNTGGQATTRIHGYNSSKVWVQQITSESVADTVKWDTAFTVPEGISFVRVSTGYPLPDGQLEKGSVATPWTPYANVCPINGWTGVSGQRCGKNFITGDKYQRTGNNTTVYFLANRPNDFPTFLKKGTYTFSIEYSTQRNNYPNLYYIRSGISQVSLGAIESSKTFEIDEDGFYRFWVYANPDTRDPIYPDEITQFWLELGSTATEYEEYTGEEISVSFSETVYGGNDDIVNGEGLSTMGMVDLGGLNWYYSLGDGNPYFYTMNFNAKPKADQSLLNNAICSQYEQTGYNAVNGNNGKFGISVDGTYLKVCDTSYTSSADFKTAMAGVMLCYELATPQTFTHEGQSVDTLVGQNNVFVDTGDISVTYQSTSGSTPVRTSFKSPLNSYSYSALKLFGNTFIEHGKG